MQVLNANEIDQVSGGIISVDLSGILRIGNAIVGLVLATYTAVVNALGEIFGG